MQAMTSELAKTESEYHTSAENTTQESGKMAKQAYDKQCYENRKKEAAKAQKVSDASY